jgi:hypothetical protein
VGGEEALDQGYEDAYGECGGSVEHRRQAGRSGSAGYQIGHDAHEEGWDISGDFLSADVREQQNGQAGKEGYKDRSCQLGQTDLGVVVARSLTAKGWGRESECEPVGEGQTDRGAPDDPQEVLADGAGDSTEGKVALRDGGEFGDFYDRYVENHHCGLAHQLDSMFWVGWRAKKRGPLHSQTLSRPGSR